MKARFRRSIETQIPTGQNEETSLTLAHAKPGKKYRIVKIEGGHKINCKLCAMGLMPKEMFSVYTTSRGGPVCVAIKGSRFAIGRGMTNRIIIEEI